MRPNRFASLDDIADVEREYPGLRSHPWTPTSRKTRTYNCIAWAMGDRSRYWWPGGSSRPTPRSRQDWYWPAWAPTDELADSTFLALFGRKGYRICADGSLRRGMEKVALYCDHLGVSHAARQLASGDWTSKIGDLIDIKHDVDALRDEVNGTRVVFLQRRRPRRARRKR